MKKRLHPLYLGLSILLLVLAMNWFHPVITAAQPPLANLRTEAQTLTQQGLEQLNRGNAAGALRSWEQSTILYRQLEFQEGITGSLINQSLAMQALGFHPRACEVLTQALQLKRLICDRSRSDRESDEFQKLNNSIREIPDTKVNIKGLRALGETLRLIGKLNYSEKVLSQALLVARHLNSDVDELETLLSLANTSQSAYKQAKDKYKITDDALQQEKLGNTIQQKAKLSISQYQQVAANALKDKQVELRLKAQLNLLGLLTNLNHELGLGNLELSGLRTDVQQQIYPLLNQLLAERDLFSDLPPIQSVYAELNFVESLAELSRSPSYSGDDLTSVMSELLQRSLTTSQALSNQRAESHTWGALGRLALQANSISTAKTNFEKALGLAQSVWAWDIAYQWQQELGRIYVKESNYSQATTLYRSAIGSLNQVSGDILSSNPDFQFSFMERVEPVYKEFIHLLLISDAPDLKEVIQVNESLRIAELENFLHCGKLNVAPFEKMNNLDDVAVIHTIVLGEQVEVIVQSPAGEMHHYSVDAESFRLSASNLLISLQSPNLYKLDERRLQTYSKELYNALLRPAKKYLPASGVLIFVPDTTLQNIPMSILHDGDEYLLSKYKIVTSLAGTSQQPKLLDPERLNALIAGVSKDSPSLKDSRILGKLEPLPEVEAEIKGIRDLMSSSSQLVNEQFTQKALQSQLSSGNFPILHITSHAVYSSNPDETFILAWDEPIDIRQFNQLIRPYGKGYADIELLVLSACQTAKGDRRSPLGIAGVAAQAGARSTVASLWLVDASSTTKLMEQFYSELKAGQPKAEALRKAQLSLLNSPEYSHPYYWAPFILVGSWL